MLISQHFCYWDGESCHEQEVWHLSHPDYSNFQKGWAQDNYSAGYRVAIWLYPCKFLYSNSLVHVRFIQLFVQQNESTTGWWNYCEIAFLVFRNANKPCSCSCTGKTHFSLFKLWFTLRALASAAAPWVPVSFNSRLLKRWLQISVGSENIENYSCFMSKLLHKQKWFSIKSDEQLCKKVGLYMNINHHVIIMSLHLIKNKPTPGATIRVCVLEGQYA